MKRLACLAVVVGTISAFASAQPGATLPASVAGVLVAPVGAASAPSLSADGRYVAFASTSPTLVPGDTNSLQDIFVRDLWLRTTRRVSVSSLGRQANNESTDPEMSANGRFVVFRSLADNLVAGDTNEVWDIFVHDLETGATVRANVSTSGNQTLNSSFKPSISGDGRLVVFDSPDRFLTPGITNPWSNVFVRDMSLGTTELLSRSWTGLQSPGVTMDATISANGRYVAFRSNDDSLVPGDTNGTYDLFVRDLVDGSITIASRSSTGEQENSISDAPSFSADGRFLAFRSMSSNLMPVDTNTHADVFVRDLASGAIVMASVTSAGVAGFGISEEPGISADGRYVAFRSHVKIVPEDLNLGADIYVRDLQTGTTRWVSYALGGQQPNADSVRPTISGDGSRVAFQSSATNFMPGDTNGQSDVFVRDRGIDLMWRANLSSDAAMGNGKSENPAVNTDGRFIAFESSASDLVSWDQNGQQDVALKDMALGTTTIVSVSTAGALANNESTSPSVDASGRFVAFDSLANNLVLDDTNSVRDVFVRNIEDWTTERISVTVTGAQANGASFDPSISADGRFVTFLSSATNLFPGDANGAADVFIRDRSSGFTGLLSATIGGAQANAGSSSPKISANGQIVAFSSMATNLVASDTNAASDVFSRTVGTSAIQRVSLPNGGGQANGASDSPSISADGRFVAFASFATNLIPGDTNNARDVFVRDVQTGTTQRVSVASAGGQANGASTAPAISEDGRFVAFESAASNLVPGDTNGRTDLFVRDLSLGTTRRVSLNSSGDPANDLVSTPSISGNGKFVAFHSWATNLTGLPRPGGSSDVYRYEIPPHQTHVSGMIVLNDFTGPRAAPGVMFELVPAGGGATVTVGPVALGAGGAYSFSTSASGPHDVYAKAPTFLRRKYAGTIAVGGGPVSGVDFVLINGDVDGSNVIDLDDFLILAAHYEAVPVTDLRTDLSGDNAVNLDDFLILAANYEVRGD